MSGILYTADYSGCRVMSPSVVKNLFLTALKLAKANVVEEVYHEFGNGALSGSVILKESHSSIHTWPENKFVSFDLFCCGETVNALAAINYLSVELHCERFDTDRIPRMPINEAA